MRKPGVRARRRERTRDWRRPSASCLFWLPSFWGRLFWLPSLLPSWQGLSWRPFSAQLSWLPFWERPSLLFWGPLFWAPLFWGPLSWRAPFWQRLFWGRLCELELSGLELSGRPLSFLELFGARRPFWRACGRAGRARRPQPGWTEVPASPQPPPPESRW